MEMPKIRPLHRTETPDLIEIKFGAVKYSNGAANKYINYSFVHLYNRNTQAAKIFYFYREVPLTLSVFLHLYHANLAAVK